MMVQLIVVAAVCASMGSSLSNDQEIELVAENPPQILLATTIDGDELELVSYQTIFIGFEGDSYNSRSLRRVTLEGVKIYDIAGNELANDAANMRLGRGETPVLATSYGQPIAEPFRKLFREETLVFVFPKESPRWKEIQEPGRPVRK